MKSVNKVILLGNVGKDPVISQTGSGTALAKFSLATNGRFKGKDGQWQDRTEWVNITAWAKLAEIAGEYLKKGSKCYIEGRLETQKWEGKDGITKYFTSVVASELVLLDGKTAQGEPVTAQQADSDDPDGIPFWEDSND